MRIRFDLVVTLAAAALAGCSEVAQFSVLRPAMFNVTSLGNTIAVGQILDPTGGEAGGDVTADLTNRVANSLNPTIQLAAAGNGGVLITGWVASNDYFERFYAEPNQCSRSVPAGTNGQGQTTYRTEYYSCPRRHREGTSTERIQLTLVNVQTGMAIYTRLYERTATQDTYTTGFGPPPRIDAQGMLHQLRAQIVEQFARVILPWREVVRVRFETCDGEARCSQAFQLIQHGNLATAESLYAQVIGANGSASEPLQPVALNRRVSGAFYDRGMVRAYMGNFDGAIGDLTRALSLRPDVSRWRTEMGEVQEMARESVALSAQIATPVPPPTMPPPGAVAPPAVPVVNSQPAQPMGG